MKLSVEKAALVPQADIDISAERLPLRPDKVYVAFGGGVGRFGANFCVFKTDRFCVWVDAGAGFPDETLPGLQKTLPDGSVIAKFPPDAIILTHGHEDHIGAIPHLLPSLKPDTPFYLSGFTAELLKLKLREAGISPDSVTLRVLDQNSVHEISPDTEFRNFFMPHSIPQVFSVGLHFRAAKKKIYFTSDFKMTGAESRFSESDIRNFGPVDYLFIDSTGALSAGTTTDERDILENLDRAVASWNGRIFLTTFSSHIERIRGLHRICQENGRQLGLHGYSLRLHIRAAAASGEFPYPPELLHEPAAESKKSLWVISGCQADKNSSLQKLATGQPGRFRLRPDDLFIYSASMIPGNESVIYKALNAIADTGATVIGPDSKFGKLHASGHGRQEDILALTQLVKPVHIIPVHGDALHFHSFRQFLPGEYSIRLRMAQVHRLYELGDSFTPLTPLGSRPMYVESGEIHSDSGLYQKRTLIAEAGIANIIITSGYDTLIDLNLVGVSSFEFQQLSLDNLKAEISAILKRTESKSGRKKALIRIQNAIYQKMRKKPYINLIEI